MNKKEIIELLANLEIENHITIRSDIEEVAGIILKSQQYSDQVIAERMPDEEEETILVDDPKYPNIGRRIENALYTTNKFTTEECTELAIGILRYINDYYDLRKTNK